MKFGEKLMDRAVIEYIKLQYDVEEANKNSTVLGLFASAFFWAGISSLILNSVELARIDTQAATYEGLKGNAYSQRFGELMRGQSINLWPGAILTGAGAVFGLLNHIKQRRRDHRQVKS